MNLRHRPAQAAPQQSLTAEAVRAEAAEHRARAKEARSEAARVLAAAQTAAAELIATAQARANEFASEAAHAERTAAPLEERAGYLAEAERLRAQIPDAELLVVRLTREAEQLSGSADQLGVRLAALGEERETTGAQLVAAREEGDVESVTALRGRLAAVAEVATVLQGQLQSARRRLGEIGEPDGTGELARAAASWQGLAAELRRFENQLDPGRPEAVADRLVGELEASLSANLQRIAEEQAGPGPARTTPLTHR